MSLPGVSRLRGQYLTGFRLGDVQRPSVRPTISEVCRVRAGAGLMRASGSPSALNNQTTPRPRCATARLPFSSIANPSGPPPPVMRMNAPTLKGVPSTCIGTRQTALSRVTLTKMLVSSSDSTSPLGLGIFDQQQFQATIGAQAIEPATSGSCRPVKPWSVKYKSPLPAKMRSLTPLKRLYTGACSTNGVTDPLDGSSSMMPLR